MKQQLWVGLISLCAGAVVAQVASDADEIVTNGVYIGPDKVDRSLQGVCHYTETEIECWDVSGIKRPELRAQLLANLAEPAARLESVPVVHGSRSLCLLFRERPQVWKVLGAQEVGPLTGRFGPVAITVPSSKRQFSLRAEFNTRLEREHLQLELKRGSVASVPGLKVSYLSAEVTHPPLANIAGIDALRGDSVWQINCGFESAEESPQIVWGIRSSDAGGKPIEYVDMAGNPISATRYLQLIVGATPAEPRALPAQTIVVGAARRKMPLYSNINPKYIKSLSFVWMKKLNVQFKDIPAYPKEER